MIVYLAVAAFIVEVGGGLYAYIELLSTYGEYKKGKYIDNSIKHSVEHISSLCLMIICNVSLITWLFVHNGFTHAWEVHVIGEHLWIVILLFGTLKAVLSSHLRKERINN